MFACNAFSQGASLQLSVNSPVVIPSITYFIHKGWGAACDREFMKDSSKEHENWKTLFKQKQQKEASLFSLQC